MLSICLCNYIGYPEAVAGTGYGAGGDIFCPDQRSPSGHSDQSVSLSLSLTL